MTFAATAAAAATTVENIGERINGIEEISCLAERQREGIGDQMK